MGPFPNSEGYEYILFVIDYVSKWVEALPCRAADAMHSKRMFYEVMFLRYGFSRIVISDLGSLFINRTFQKALTKVGVDRLIIHSRKLSQKLELIAGLPLHITLKRAVKQKH
jgi:hypothetical protein